MSMVTRISLLAACAVGIAVAIASLSAYVTLRSQLHRQLDESLLSRASAATQTLVTRGALNNISGAVLGAADLRLYLIRANGVVISPQDPSWVLPLSPDELAVARGQRGDSLRTITKNGVDSRAATVPVGKGSALMFVQSQEPIERTLDKMAVVLLLVGLGGIVAAGLIGLAVARSALRPVRRLSAAAEHVARTEELSPIPITGDDELASLAASFNEMLVALAGSRDRQRQLVADAGHELRTPLTSLRTNLELLAQAARQGGLTPAQRDEIFTDVTAQVEELSTLVGDLVELARDEPLERTPEPLDLADILARAVDRVRRRAPGLTFDVHTAPWWVVGEAQILERAVTNLLDNAAKWSPPHGTVTVSLTGGLLTVSDQGPGIAETDLPLVFERFYRASDARRMPGSGLGLSIVRQAAERHGGMVRAANHAPHGAVLRMGIPGSPTHPNQPKARPDPARDTAARPPTVQPAGAGVPGAGDPAGS
jgi:two-component system, OmpR family, sensor histidine kinase MprB